MRFDIMKPSEGGYTIKALKSVCAKHKAKYLNCDGRSPYVGLRVVEIDVSKVEDMREFERAIFERG